MPKSYPIFEVQEALDQEDMGSKEKFWYLPEGETTKWLFKYPREDTGEHWAEKVAAEVANGLGTPHGGVELAVFEGRRGSVTESFVSEGEELVHGNQVLGGTLRMYDTKVKRGQSDHTFENIWLALERFFIQPKTIEKAKLHFAAYVVLDAVIGNTDRHHENWGILRDRKGTRWTGVLAPSFDHASSLGRELSDEQRNRFITEGRVGGYADRGRGGIYWFSGDTYGRSPLELARLAAQAHPDAFRPAINKLKRLDEDSLRGIMDRMPENWMSTSAQSFAIQLMCHNVERILRFAE